MILRPARPDEAEALTGLALRAKASWGYDAAFMAACRAELTLIPEKLAAWDVRVAELDGRLAGLIALRLDGRPRRWRTSSSSPTPRAAASAGR